MPEAAPRLNASCTQKLTPGGGGREEENCETGHAALGEEGTLLFIVQMFAIVKLGNR